MSNDGLCLLTVIAAPIVGELIARWFLPDARPWIIGVSIALGVVMGMLFGSSAEERRSTDGVTEGIMVFFIVAPLSYPILCLIFAIYWYCIAVPVVAVGSAGRAAMVELERQSALARVNELECKDKERQARDKSNQASDARAKAAKDATDGRRRRDARAKCEMHYTLHAADLRERFPRSSFDKLMKEYMRESDPPDELDSRAEQIVAMIDRHRAATSPAKPRFNNVEELVAWYIAEKEKISKLPIDEAFREEHLIRLNTIYSDLTERVMEQER